MSDATHDLTGHWIGIFNYPELLPPNQFQAVLSDVAGAIEGETREVNDEPEFAVGDILRASIAGHRDGSEVWFNKVYDDAEFDPLVIFYSGTVDAAGDEVAGEWERDDGWSGTFIMVRQSGAAEEAGAETEQTVKV